VHRPIVSERLSKLSRAVQGVDEPDPVVLEAPLVVLAFLREDGIVGA